MPGPADYVREFIARGEIQRGLDIGCGYSSILTPFRPKIHTVGLDAFDGAIAESKARGHHDTYVLADILKVPTKEILDQAGGQPVDIVTLIDVIEHLPKRLGFELLEKCEALSRKYVLLVTPNGFLAQGPEHGNPYQRHLSGWFPHDFEGLGYTVRGTMGTRFLRGYAALPCWNLPGLLHLDWGLGWLLRAKNHPRFAFGLLAVKDLRGVPARIGNRCNKVSGRRHKFAEPNL